VSAEEREQIEAAWDENWYEGMEELGWSNDDTEYWFQGPLKLVNKDTGEEFSVLDENFNIIPETLPVEEPKLTEWYQLDVAPVREGSYQVIGEFPHPGWPFPIYATWDGQKWSDDSIQQWRGLAEDPNK
jgi:hypothetical protein